MVGAKKKDRLILSYYGLYYVVLNYCDKYNTGNYTGFTKIVFVESLSRLTVPPLNLSIQAEPLVGQIRSIFSPFFSPIEAILAHCFLSPFILQISILPLDDVSDRAQIFLQFFRFLKTFLMAYKLVTSFVNKLYGGIIRYTKLYEVSIKI